MAKPGSTTQRGYGHEHQLVRAEYARDMARGVVYACWRCGIDIDPNGPWDLGHDDLDRSVYRGPEHVGCNRATNGRRRVVRRRVL